MRIIIILFLILASCKDSTYSKQIKLCEDLLLALKANDSSYVKMLLDSSQYRFDPEIVIHHISAGNYILNKFSMPEKSKYKIIRYPDSDIRLCDIIIGFDAIGENTITVEFMKYLPKNKIYDFSVYGDFPVDNPFE